MAGSLLIFVLGPARVRLIIQWWQSKPIALLRAAGLIAIAFGAIIIYCA
ncbi:MAG: hypothetical protein JXB29_05695 [Sedimentisphaerales bacterium]|nr:hypothetical protein [Sedimentisphaerales bacterium]